MTTVDRADLGEPAPEGKTALEDSRAWRQGRRRGLIVLLICAAVIVLAWLGGRLVLVPDVPLVLNLASNKPISGSISYETAGIGSRGESRTIAPEQVAVAEQPQRDVTVTVTPLGKGSSRSRAAEVWLYEVSSSYQSVGATGWGQMSLPSPWTAKGATALNAAGDPVPLAVGLGAGAYVDVKMVMHPWSGRVRLDVNGHSRVVDLYSPYQRTASFRTLLPLSAETQQLVSTDLPASAKNLKLNFSDGPRLIRIQGVQWESSPAWTWPRSGASTPVAGRGVSIVGNDCDGVLLRVEGQSGTVTFPSIRTNSYWIPRTSDLLAAVVLAAGIACLALIALAAAGGAYALGLWRPRHRFVGSGSQSAERPRMSRIVDRAILLLASMWLVTSAGGLLIAGAGSVGQYGRSVNGRDSVRSPALPSVVYRAWAKLPSTRTWWGRKPFPTRDGSDFLRVLSHQPPDYALGGLLGEVVRRANRDGMVVREIIVPEDASKLLWAPVGGYVLADGTVAPSTRTPLSVLVRVFADAPIVTRVYDPVLTQPEAKQLESKSVLRRQTDEFYLGTPAATASGTWILYSVDTVPRRYLLVPLEISPTGGGL